MTREAKFNEAKFPSIKNETINVSLNFPKNSTLNNSEVDLNQQEVQIFNEEPNIELENHEQENNLSGSDTEEDELEIEFSDEDIHSDLEPEELHVIKTGETPNYKQWKAIENNQIILEKRKRKTPSKYTLNTSTDVIIPKTYNLAMESVQKEKWKEAINAELNSLNTKNVWTIISKPAGSKLINTQWIFSIKRNSKNEIEKFKARLVAVGSSQRFGIDYDEVFSPVIRWETIRTFLSHAINNNYQIFQLDVETAYLNGKIDRDLYIRLPQGISHKCGQVGKLNKALYGLKQSGRLWNYTIKRHNYETWISTICC